MTILPVANGGKLGTSSAASLMFRLETLKLLASSKSSSSSKSSISSTVSSWTCWELNDSDLVTVDLTGEDAKSGTGDGSRGADEDKKERMGGDVKAGTHGGALLGGEPEDSVFVTKKNSSVVPVLFYKTAKKI